MEHKAMMSDGEVALIENILQPYFVCLEFGSGYSTFYFPQFVDVWYSVEHDRDWFAKVNERKPDNVKLDLAPLDVYPYYYSASDIQFDFILIDGERRRECLETAVRIIKPEGIILLHDAMRIEYKDWVDTYPHTVLCKGEMPDTRLPGEYYLIRGLYQYAHHS